MKPNEREDGTVEAAIEAALSGEPLLPVPESLHRRITDRLHVAALTEQERRRFRHGVAMSALSLAALVPCIGLFAILAGAPGLFRDGAPGVRGYFDYLTMYTWHAWSGTADVTGLILPPLFVLALVLMLLPLRRFVFRRPAAP